MLADDFLGGIAFDALRAGVPVGDDAAGVEHVDGVIGHPLHQNAEPPLALQQRVLRRFPLRHVAGDLREADMTSRLVMHFVEGGRGPEARAVPVHAPALALVVPGFFRRRQDLRRQAALLIFAGEEARKMLADDFGRRVSLQTFRARVPAITKPSGSSM